MFALFYALLGVSMAQDLVRTGDLLELTFTSPNGAEAHKSANRFASLVGDELKARYPSRVLDPDVELRVFHENGEMLFRMVWSCRIVPAPEDVADYYFDRRGTLLSGPTILQARQNVQEQIGTSDKIAELRRAFPDGRIPLSFIRDTFSGSTEETYWYMTEYFLVAPRTPLP